MSFQTLGYTICTPADSIYTINLLALELLYLFLL